MSDRLPPQHLRNRVKAALVRTALSRTPLSRTALPRRVYVRSWVKAALEQYGIQDARFALLKEGRNLRRLTFRVESPTRGRFVLRGYRISRRDENLMPELLWLQALQREMPHSVPDPVPAVDGSLVSHVPLEGGLELRRCVLLHWLPGISGAPDEVIRDPASLSQAGSSLARLHRHYERHGVPEGLVFPYVWSWDWVFGEAVPLWSEGKSVYSRSELDVFRATAERIRYDLRELGKDSSVFGIIHRDPHLNNFLFQDGKACIIDFELCGWGYYLFDLAVTLSSLEAHQTPRPSAFLEGYQRERPLPEEHWRYLETFMVMRLAQRINKALGWKGSMRRSWGTSYLSSEAVGWLEEFLASERNAGQMDLGSPWWREAFRK